MSNVIQVTTQEDIAFITVNNPPVNALSYIVRKELYDAITFLEENKNITAIIIRCDGKTFIAGADIKEFGQAPKDPILPDLIQKILSTTKPIIAAIHGNALGGGLEIALACHYRIADQSAMLGLPEVKLGLIPGAGGTQLLPRIVGIPKALDMITSGRSITSDDALKCELLDKISYSNLEQDCKKFVNEHLSKEYQTTIPTSEKNKKLKIIGIDSYIADFEKKIKSKYTNQVAPLASLEAIKASTKLPFNKALSFEREQFKKCLNSPQRAAMIHSFFAERKAKKLDPSININDHDSINHVGIIGGGTMGIGIALSFINAHIPVLMLEVSEEKLKQAIDKIQTNLSINQKKGRVSKETLNKQLNLLTGTVQYENFKKCDLIIEAAFENLKVKESIFHNLNKIIHPDTILASNTSSLDLNQISSFCNIPQNFIGLHFFSPANIMRLVEVVQSHKTSNTTLAKVVKLVEKIKKVPVTVGVCDGFVGNRMIFAYGRQAEFLLEEGASPLQVDHVLTSFGMAMGPFAVRDLSGLDISFAIRKEQKNKLTNELSLPEVLDNLYHQGMLGQKSGEGFFKYKKNDRTVYENKKLTPILEDISAKKGITRKKISSQEVLERCLYALINEGAKILEENIAKRASDIDVIFINGYGFPNWRGGPMYYADTIGLKTILNKIEDFYKTHGAWWKPAPLLKHLVKTNQQFSNFKV